MSDPFTHPDLAEKRRYIASRVDRDHWGASELAHVDHEARWLATVDSLIKTNLSVVASLQAENADLRASIGEVAEEPRVDGMGLLQWSIHQDSLRRWSDMDIDTETMALAEEACEALAALFRAVVKRRHGTRGSHEDWTAKLRQEVAQVAAVLFNIAAIEGFDLLDAVQSEHERWVKTDTNHDPIAALGAALGQEGDE